jgi:hypothetical protein
MHCSSWGPSGISFVSGLIQPFRIRFPEVSKVEESFADNFSVGASGRNLNDIDCTLNEDMFQISKWSKSKCQGVRVRVSESVLESALSKLP